MFPVLAAGALRQTKWRFAMRSLDEMELDQIVGGGDDVPVPLPGVQEQWDALQARLEWERRNPYRRQS